MNLSTRAPVQWRRPLRNWLERGGIYPSERPPFDPFPTVSDVISAHFCPVAILHRLLHGIELSPGLIAQRGREGAGELYHSFIAFLKSSITNGRLRPPSLGMIRQEFLRFGGDPAILAEIWRSYLEPWSRNRLSELAGISQGERMFFEVTVASEYVPFRREGQTLTYPLRGVIDEINLDRQLIIERTIVGGPDDQEPPESEARQLWLLWKILSSIRHDNFPRELSEVDFSNFHLVVETPFRPFPVDKQNREFEEEVHDAYTWIRDLTLNPRSIPAAYDNQRCELQPGLQCNFMYSVCRRRRFQYPRARPAMHQEFRHWYRPLLWELIWDWHLLQYKLLRLPTNTLEEEGWAVRANVASFLSQDMVELEIVREEETGPVLAHMQDAGKCELIFGTPFVGQRVEVALQEPRENRFVVRTERRYILMSNSTLILPDITLLESRPWYLTRNVQRNMFRFEHLGRENPATAGQDSLVQLIEGLFGARVLRRERSNGSP